MQNQRKRDDTFVNQAVNNMDYVYKQQAKHGIITFLSNQTSFRPFDTMRDDKGNFIFFLELRGFIQIGNSYSHQMLIGVPKNFPQGPPIFLLSVNRATHRINREPQLIKSRQIYFQKDQRGVQFIKFNYPFMTYGWKPMSSLLETFNQFRRIINQPPLLVEINSSSQNINPYNEWEIFNNEASKNNKNNKPVDNKQKSGLDTSKLHQLIDNKSIDLSNSFSTLQQLQKRKQKSQYFQSRNNFLLNDHLKELQVQLVMKSNQLVNKMQEAQKIVQQCQEKSQCDSLLLLSPKDNQKLQRMAQRQALREAQKKVKETIQKDLQSEKKKFSDYKKIVRSLFSQMYDNQTKILQVSQ